MKRRIAALSLALMLLLAGCGSSGETVLHGNELLAIDNSVCSWAEAQIFILAQYSLYGKTYGDGIWKVELSDGNFESYIKAALLNYLKLLFLVDYGAKKQNITLSEAETDAISRAAEQYTAALGEEACLRTGITKEIAEQAFRRYLIAQIFYRQTETDSSWEISDEEARVISLLIVEVDPRQGYTQVREISEKLTEGKSVSEALRGYDGVSSRRENVVRGTYSEEFDTLTFALKTGQWSPIFMEGSNYVIVQCQSSYLEEETAVHKAQMEKDAREKSLNDLLVSYAESVQLIYNPKLWDSWNMSQFSTLPAVNFYDYCDGLKK